MPDEFKGLILAHTEEDTKVIGELKDAKLTLAAGSEIDFECGHMEIGGEDVILWWQRKLPEGEDG